MKKKFTILTAVVMLLAFLAVPLGMRGQAPVNTILWSEAWTGGSSGEKPSDYGFEGTSVYGGTTLTYTQNDNDTKLYTGTMYAGGTEPELLLKSSNKTWTISNIPTGQATEMTLTFLSNRTTFNVSSTTNGISISGSQKSWTITATGSVENFNLTIKNTGSQNARIDNIELKVKTAGTPPTPSVTISPDAISKDYNTYSSSGYDDLALSISTENIASPSYSNFSVVYCNVENGTYTDANPSWMNAFVVQSSSFKVGWYLAANETTSSREYYFKVMYGETPSNAVHVTQGAAPAPTYTVTLTGGNTISADYGGDVTSSTITVSTNLTGEVVYEVYYNNSGTYSGTNPYDEWFEAEVNASNEIECTILPNSTGAERPAQFKVFAMNDEYDEAYSEVITLTQAAVATPTFDPNGATFHGTQNVSLVSATPGASIRYTLDGTIPTATTGIEYENGTPIQLTSTKTVKAIAYVNVNEVNITSSVSEATFTQEQTAAPSFDPVAGAVLSGTTVTISCTTANAAIQYSTDDGVTWNNYTEPIAITAATTIKAKATATGYAPSAVAEAAYTIATPYTVAQARTIIDQGEPYPTGVYVSGIVTRRYNDNLNNGKISYYISDDGTQNDELEAYKGKGLNGADFEDINDIQAGDIVIVCGDLTKWGETYELEENNYLISLTRNPSITFEPSSVTFDENYNNQTVTYTVHNYQQWSSVTATDDADWLTVATPSYPTSVNPTGTVLISANGNTGTQRSATVTLTYTYGGGKTVTGTFTVSQKGAAAFVNGVYSEPLRSQASLNNMTVIDANDNDNTWYLEVAQNYSCATISGSASGDEDWLITPKMAVENGKIAISFSIWHDQDNQNKLSVKWSTSNDISGTWNTLTFDEGDGGETHVIPNIEITTEAEYIYVAFVYASSEAGEYSIMDFYGRYYYNVTFAANGGSGTMEPQSIAAGVATPLTANTFTAPADKVFNGWDDGNGHTYANEAEITLAGNVTLTAQWADAYTVTFTTNGIADGTIQVAKDQAISTQPVATDSYIPADYEFKGWYTDDYYNATDAPTYVTFPYTPTGDVTLKAVFAEATETQSLENKTYTLSPNDFSGSSYSANDGDKTIHDVSLNIKDVMKQNGAIQFKKTSGQLYNNNALGNYITSIVIDISSGTFNVYEGDSKNPSTSVTSSGSGNTKTYTFSSNKTFFKVTGNTAGAAQANSITVNYVTTGATTYTYSNYRTSYIVTCDDLVINGYGTTTGKDGYRLIASPVFVSPDNVDYMVDGTFDLYYFNEAMDHEEWRNYEANVFDLVPGKGYLYANSAEVTLTFEGAPYGGDGVITLDYTDGASWAGWNLIGNPFNCNAYLTDTTGKGMAFYRMNSDGNGFDAVAAGAINVMEGIFVKASEENQSITFTKTAPNLNPGKGNLNISLAQTVTNRGAKGDTDNAIVRFDGGNTLEKFSFRDNTAKVYIPQDGKDYAVVSAENQGVMPVNFKASENGNYTLSFTTENVAFSYLHLIDNMTGNDVDLLATPNYNFDARYTDYASRFKLVFAKADNGDSEQFAFISNGELILSGVDGNSTVQIVDVTGRILSSTTGTSHLNTNDMAAGVYVLRLINGDNVKTQKIVVK